MTHPGDLGSYCWSGKPGASAAGGAGDFCSLSWERCPRRRLPVTPRGIHHHMGRTAGLHGCYNCHLLLVHTVRRGTRRLNQKNSSASRLFTSQAKQRAPLGWGSSRPPLSSVISARRERGCVSVCMCVLGGEYRLFNIYHKNTKQ